MNSRRIPANCDSPIFSNDRTCALPLRPEEADNPEIRNPKTNDNHGLQFLCEKSGHFSPIAQIEVPALALSRELDLLLTSEFDSMILHFLEYPSAVVFRCSTPNRATFSPL